MTEEPFEEMEEDSDLWQSLDEDEDEEGMVFFVLQESTGYMAPTLRALAVIHTIISFLCVIGYYCLKVSHFLYLDVAINPSCFLSYYYFIKRHLFPHFSIKSLGYHLSIDWTGCLPAFQMVAGWSGTVRRADFFL